jgi:hypothetical protein
MTFLRSFTLGLVLAVVQTVVAASDPASAPASEPLLDAQQRFAEADGQEIPDFQRHVAPLLGRLGCNGRNCHGSFQGRGGFRLSLFGYDFSADHQALTSGDSPRVSVADPDESLVLRKPLGLVDHEGGQRLAAGSWQHHLLRRWITGGANPMPRGGHRIERLQVEPAEIFSESEGESIAMRATAFWSDGTAEVVTSLCRFQTNDEHVARVDEHGLLTLGQPGDTHLIVYYDSAVVAVPVLKPAAPTSAGATNSAVGRTELDRHVLAKLNQLRIVPSAICTDEEFLRRVSLDLAGTLPSAAEVERFLADASPDKRSAKIDELLETPAYAAWWTTRLCDYTGNNEQRLNNIDGIQGNGAGDWYDWIYRRVRGNEPYDRLMAGIVLGTSRNKDESYNEYCAAMSAIRRGEDGVHFADRESMPYFWARRNFTSADDRAIGFAYSFLGVRLQCAQCHKHPFDQWTQSDFNGFKKFFEAVVANSARPSPRAKQEYDAMIEELELDEKKLKGNDRSKTLAALLKKGRTVPFGETYVDLGRLGAKRREKGKAANEVRAKLLGGDEIALTGRDDPREAVMRWLRDPTNPYFARAFVNRVWANYFHAGIVEPPDDMSLANPPSNAPLLDYLTREFIAHEFDMKWLHRVICNSDTYQRSWETNATNRNDERNFSRAVPRRLPAEVAYDAISRATASDARASEYLDSSAGRAIGIPGASGRSDRGGNNGARFALHVFGRSTRESNCDCDRSMEASLLQTVYLQNDASVLSAIADTKDSWAHQVGREVTRAGEGDLSTIDRWIDQAFLRTLSRHPTAQDLERCRAYFVDSRSARDGLSGLLWALLNTKEFIVNH